MASSAAARQRRHRQRKRDGIITLIIHADEIALAEQLAIAGFLAPADMDDRSAIRAALEHVVSLWAQGWSQDVTRNGQAFRNPLL